MTIAGNTAGKTRGKFGMIVRNKEIRSTLIAFAVTAVLFAVINLFTDPRSALLTVLCSAVLFIIYYISVRKRYKDIAKLSEIIDETIHGKAMPEFKSFSEGELSVLENEIRKLFISIKEKNEQLIVEKTVLSDSLADISHQIRTPLTSINIILSLLQNPETDEEQRAAYITELYSLLDATDKLVTLLLKIARLDADAAIFEKKTVKVSDCIKNSVSVLDIALDIKNIELVYTPGEESFFGDPVWTSEAISNIIKNSIEHTPENGRIEIIAEETAIYTAITVKDSGSGIDENDLPRLFERFYRGGTPSSNNFGIGLNLANMIVKKQNGTLKAGNCPGGGAFFEIKFYKCIV